MLKRLARSYTAAFSRSLLEISIAERFWYRGQSGFPVFSMHSGNRLIGHLEWNIVGEQPATGKENRSVGWSLFARNSENPVARLLFMPSVIANATVDRKYVDDQTSGSVRVSARVLSCNAF